MIYSETINYLIEKGLYAVLTVLAVMCLLCLIRAIRGPRIADRVVAVNMLGTIIIAMILDLAVLLGEGYLADVAVIYAMLSFLAVVILTKVYLGVHAEKLEDEAEETTKKSATAVDKENKKSQDAANIENKKTTDAANEDKNLKKEGEKQ